MSKLVDVVNAAGAVVVIALALVVARPGARLREDTLDPDAHPQKSEPVPVRLPDGRLALRDARGNLVPLGRYTRIASGSTLADRVLLELCEPDRIVAFTQISRLTPQGFRFAGKGSIEGFREIEPILALRPDLVLVNGFASGNVVARLQDAGVAVFDLGSMEGLSTLIPNVLQIGHLVGRLDDARGFAATFTARLDRIARAAPAQARPSAVYVGVHGDKLIGGTRGTSYHDVLTKAGLIDVAAVRFAGWPRLESEDLLTLDPDLVVTQEGMGHAFCRHAGLGGLRVCRTQGAIIELPAHLAVDAGLGMLEAAEVVADRVRMRAGPATQAGNAPPAPQALKPAR